MKRFLMAVALSAAAATAPLAQAQTLNMMKSLDAPHYDGHRTTWSPTSDIVNMIQDTLVALDWDGKKPLPLLARSWTMSPDGKTYTFKLRDDVQFCSGRSSPPPTSSTASTASAIPRPRRPRPGARATSRT